MPVLKNMKTKPTPIKDDKVSKHSVKEDFSSLFASLSSQMHNMFAQQQVLAADLQVTHAELRALPSGVGDIHSLSRIRTQPSATVTSADVHSEDWASSHDDKICNLIKGFKKFQRNCVCFS